MLYYDKSDLIDTVTEISNTFCFKSVWRIMLFMEEWQFCALINVWFAGNCINRWKDSKEGRWMLFMIHAFGYRQQ